jgi:glutathione S-transferase
MTKYTLYNRPGSGGFAVEAALTLADQPFDFIDVGNKPGDKMPDHFRAINPWGQVPALILPDETLMTETGAILTYLAGAHPEAGLSPVPWTPAHGTFLRWMTFLGANIYEAILHDGYPARFTDDPDGVENVKTAALKRCHEGLGVLEDAIGANGWLQDEMSVADLYLAMLFIWCKKREDRPKCEALTHRIAAHPVIAPIWRRNFDHRPGVKWGR